jgi:predicted enzyme involved in methoxymalonyl-ACP biosynthesis
VGAAFAVAEGVDEWRIDNLVLSCRILGRRVETALLSALARRVQESGADRLVGEYLPTLKNTVAAEFFVRNGFEQEEGRWVWSFSRGRIEAPSTVALCFEGDRD